MSALPTTQPDPPGAVAPRRPPGRVRAFLAANAVWKRGLALSQAIFDGVWLGVLQRDDLHTIDQRFYDKSTYQGDAHNLRGLLPWEVAALESFGGCRRLLLIGAGGGREVLALSRMGFEVEGYECNAALVAYAEDFLPRQGCTSSRVRYLPRDAVPPAGEPFDGIILGWGAYTLIPGRAHRVDLLRRLRPLIRPGGPLLLSFFTRSGDGPRFRVSATVANGIRTVLRRERVDRGDAIGPNFMHYFVGAEIEAELREAGWEPRSYTPHGSGSRDSGWAIGVAPAADGGLLPG